MREVSPAAPGIVREEKDARNQGDAPLPPPAEFPFGELPLHSSQVSAPAILRGEQDAGNVMMPNRDTRTLSGLSAPLLPRHTVSPIGPIRCVVGGGLRQKKSEDDDVQAAYAQGRMLGSVFGALLGVLVTVSVLFATQHMGFSGPWPKARDGGPIPAPFSRGKEPVELLDVPPPVPLEVTQKNGIIAASQQEGQSSSFAKNLSALLLDKQAVATTMIAKNRDVSPLSMQRASFVDPVALRFSNDCFWQKQQERQAEILEDFLRTRSGAQGESLVVVNPRDTAADDAAFQDECNRWVAQSTDATWHAKHRADREASVEKYFAKDFTSRVWGWSLGGGKEYRGLELLKTLVEKKLRTFPDLKIRVRNTFCRQAVHDSQGLRGFFTAMPDMSEGTMLGPMEILQADGSSVTIPANGKKVSYFGVAVTFVERNPETGRWQYVAEDVTHDEGSLFAALGPEAFEAFRNAARSADVLEKLSPLAAGCALPEPYWR